MYAMTGLYSETAADDSSIDAPHDSECSSNQPDNSPNETIIKCHSRQPSSSLVDRDKSLPNILHEVDDLTRDCGLLGCRPIVVQKFARIKVRTQTRVFFCSYKPNKKF